MTNGDQHRQIALGGRPVGHYAWQSGAWIVAFVVVFGWLSVRAYRRI